MKGQTLLKVTGILMIIGAVFSIIASVLVGGLGAVAAGAGAASGLTGSYWVALFLILVGGICQMIAGMKGVKHCKNKDRSRQLILWGAVVAGCSLVNVIFSAINSGELNGASLVSCVVIPCLYIYGAVQNSKEEDSIRF